MYIPRSEVYIMAMMTMMNLNDEEKMKKTIDEQFYCLSEINKKVIEKISTGKHLREIVEIITKTPYIIYYPFYEKEEPDFTIRTYTSISQLENIISVSTLYRRADILEYLLEFVSKNQLKLFNIETLIVNNCNQSLAYSSTRVLKTFTKHLYIKNILKKYGLDLLITSIEHNNIQAFKELIKNDFIQDQGDFNSVVTEIYDYDAYEMREILEDHYDVELD